MKSLAYDFILNMWKEKRVDEAFAEGQVALGRLTQQEYIQILMTSQSAE